MEGRFPFVDWGLRTSWLEGSREETVITGGLCSSCRDA